LPPGGAPRGRKLLKNSLRSRTTEVWRSTHDLAAPAAGMPSARLEAAMYEDFHIADPWTGEDLHCKWKANIVAIATRHADAVDVRFEVNGRPMWIALPCTAWVEQKKRT